MIKDNHLQTWILSQSMLAHHFDIIDLRGQIPVHIWTQIQILERKRVSSHE